MRLLKEAIRRIDELSNIITRVENIEKNLSSVNVEMIEQPEVMDEENNNLVFGNNLNSLVDVVSKSVRKAREPAPKMHSQQIEVLKTVVQEEREHEKRKNNLLIFGLNTENENGVGIS